VRLRSTPRSRRPDISGGYRGHSMKYAARWGRGPAAWTGRHQGGGHEHEGDHEEGSGTHGDPPSASAATFGRFGQADAGTAVPRRQQLEQRGESSSPRDETLVAGVFELIVTDRRLTVALSSDSPPLIRPSADSLPVF